MSILHSISVDSTSSTATMTTIPLNEHEKDLSNGLYEDRDHFHAIFSNDSRFFDTSLHLYKSYSSLGYIQSSNDKHKKNYISSLSTTSSGQKHRWRTRLLGLNHNNDNHMGTLKAFLTPTLLRKNHSTNARSDSHTPNTINETKYRHRPSPMIVQYQPSSTLTVNNTINDDSDESEITITRL